MKLRVICLLLPLFLLGCSKKSPEAERRANIQPSSTLPFQITVAESPETMEINDISNRAANLLATKDYDKLDDLAATYRASKEAYPDGMWKLAYVYAGTDGPENAPEDQWPAHQKEIEAWIQAKPQSITARVALARFLRDYAWHARGSGYANTVTDESWQLFGQRLTRAAAILTDAKNLKETCPVYWSTFLGVALGLEANKEQYDRIFDQAARAEPDYHFYYQTRAVYLLPRWHGQPGEWEEDLAKSADRIGGEDGDMLYAQVVWDIHHYGSSDNVFDENKGISWERVDRGFEVIEKRFPDSIAAKNERAHLAGLAGDKEKARKYFIQTEGKVDLSDWNAKGEFIDAANWAFAP